VGGGIVDRFTIDELQDYLIQDCGSVPGPVGMIYQFINHNLKSKLDSDLSLSENLIKCNIPLPTLVNRLKVNNLKLVAAVHGIYIRTRTTHQQMVQMINDHTCDSCGDCVTLLQPTQSSEQRRRALNVKAVRRYKQKKINLNQCSPVPLSHKEIQHKPEISNDVFPPAPLDQGLQHSIIKAWCKDMSLKHFKEVGCAVCGELTLESKSILMKDADVKLNPLICSPELTRKERTSDSDPVEGIDGPVLEPNLHHMCSRCHTSLTANKLPRISLANGMWLGHVPSALSDLTFAEQLLVARVRHNRCLVRVSSGWHKMTANAISFANPTPIVYDILPPPSEELDEVLAFIYTGPCKPTPKDFERTPLLVRRNKVRCALEWLKRNHCDYGDLEISQRNLDSYPESGPPVVVEYLSSITNKPAEATSVHDMEDEAGTVTGECPFVVHGLTGEQYSTKTLKSLKAIAMEHLIKDGKILAVGHAGKPESIYNNPQLYPQMMPWLFPYGLGGIGTHYLKDSRISDLKYKKHLLLYHDKRFQRDPHFPLIAFNHEQIKNTVTAGYLLSDKHNFENITNRLLHINKDTLESICTRLSKDERVIPETQEEKDCYQLLKDIDHVGGHVMGSMTNKKYMRNEIWSLISFIGAPSWFITFAPADNLHPISLYWADTKEEFRPEIKDYNERYRIMSKNPIASARFFHFLCELFIKDVLGVGADHRGAYGDTEAYYGTVEQQGRLALHLHLLLWIKGSLSPQDMRDKIMDPNSTFQKHIVEYLESVHIGEFMTGPAEKVMSDVQARTQDPNYKDPTQTLPQQPPPLCKHPIKEDCSRCKKQQSWWLGFKDTVDDILLKSNVHRCGGGKNGRRPTCINKQGNCKARFPRQLFEQTEVDPLTGALNIKKGEPWLNTITPVLTYVLRCNTDVTSLLSGTAVKAVVAYISDYVTKTTLKTYTMFDSIKGVYERNSEMLSGTFTRKEKARKLVTQVMNSFTAKSEIGSPMAGLYILGNPDHYTNFDFIPIYWKSFVNYVFYQQDTVASGDEPEQSSDKVIIQKNKAGQFVAYNGVFDYIYRPLAYSHLPLYMWIQTSQKCKIPKPKAKKGKVPLSNIHDEGDLSDDEINLITSSPDTRKIIQSSSVDSDADSVIDDSEDLDALNSDVDSDELDVMSNVTVDDVDESPKKEKKTQYYHFLSDHPQHETHHVTSNPKCLNKVPNFLGGSLPRRDRGDREYYCATMLVLFKPWRKLEDLKDKDHSWDEMFTSHVFTERQLELMRYFNIRYECNDARDDYSAQQKQQSSSANLSTSWLSSDFTDYQEEDIETGEDDIDYTCDGDRDDDIDRFMRLGKYGIVKQAEMDAMKRCMQMSGWLDDSPNGLNAVMQERIEPTVTQMGSKWKTTVSDKRKEVISERDSGASVSGTINSNLAHTTSQPFVENQVKIVDRTYLSKSFEASTKAAQDLINSIVKDKTLNTEQERAFRIVANHATNINQEQLKMYIGGMAGTGKSQVIKALVQFFSLRNEKHRFVILGPTGTAAALNNGSTYHSFLGIQVGTSHNLKQEQQAIAQLKEKLQGVEYIFLDEVSMLACHDLYKISSQLAKALNEHEIPFGGMNFIFAGDFAQLPPVGGKTLYSNVVSTQLNAGLSVRDQEAAIGKALWHQITTVVILRQNMRQKLQTPKDAELRNALVNMRYGKCTPDDIKFLKSLVAGRRADQPKLASKEFRNVAVICGRHTQKDQINMTGCERFAKDTGQTLIDFYSIDKWGNSPDPSTHDAKSRNKQLKAVHQKRDMTLKEQTSIWSLRPGATDHFPGKLSLCLGMPVMIRNNEATELCITKGQEGFVVGWQSVVGPHGKQVLDTLFIELDKPPRLIQIPGLPDNVVPIVKDKRTIQCIFPSDDKVSIERQQVWVLPNFAMTDYASQGKTRPHNVVHLNSCTSHQSYYTCLSRSASAEGTIIVQGFEPRVITSGCSGYLRQEFREQELLDDITRMRHENALPIQIDGNRRNTIIRQYQKWKGTSYVPEHVNKHLSWSEHDTMQLLPVMSDTPWQLVNKDQGKSKKMAKLKIATNFVPAQGSKSVTKFVPDQESKVVTKPVTPQATTTVTAVSISKKRKTEVEEVKITSKSQRISISVIPKGLVWDGPNYSCAYDALFTVLFDIWKENQFLWNVNARFLQSKYLRLLGNGFLLASQGDKTLETVRDEIRKLLHAKDAITFPYGQVGTSLSQLALEIFASSTNIAHRQDRCTNCDFSKTAIEDRLGCIFSLDFNSTVSTSYTLKTHGHDLEDRCSMCLSNMRTCVFYTEFPLMLLFDHAAYIVKPSKEIKFNCENNQTIKYRLIGLLYFGGFHFTSRIISPEGDVWYHDGMQTGNNFKSQGHRKFMNDEDWQACEGRKLVMSIYTKV